MSIPMENYRAVDDAMRATAAILDNIEKASEHRRKAALTAAIAGDHAAAAAAFNDAKMLADELDMCMNLISNATSQARVTERNVRNNLASAAEYALHRDD